MSRKETEKEQEKFEEYKKALRLVYADGSVSSAERNRLIALKNELGLSDSDCIKMESVYKLLSENTENEMNATLSAIDAYCTDGIVPKEGRFILPGTPEYLKRIGSDETEITLPVSVVKKAMETHRLTKDEIKSAVCELYDPVLAFDSDKSKTENKADSRLILTNEFKDGKPIALSVNVNADVQFQKDGHRTILEVQDIRSIHDRTLIAKNGTDLIKKWTEDGLCRYVDDKKITGWSTIARVYFPIEVLQSANNNILRKSDIVNSKNDFQEYSDEMDKGIEQMQTNDGMSEAAKEWAKEIETKLNFGMEQNISEILAESEATGVKENAREIASEICGSILSVYKEIAERGDTKYFKGGERQMSDKFAGNCTQKVLETHGVFLPKYTDESGETEKIFSTIMQVSDEIHDFIKTNTYENFLHKQGSVTQQTLGLTNDKMAMAESLQDKFRRENEVAFRKLDAYLETGETPKNNEFLFGSLPDVLKYAAVPDHEVVLTTGIITKARKTHQLSNETIRKAITTLADPVAVFDSDRNRTENKSTSIIAITDVEASNGKPVALSLNLGVQRKGFEQQYIVNEIRSVHDRTLVAKNGVNITEEWADAGLLRYVDDKKISRIGKEREDSFLLPLAKLDIETVHTKSRFVKQANPGISNARMETKIKAQENLFLNVELQNRERAAEQAATNFLMQKLKKVGVEVVSDNKTFENMLAYVNGVNICLEMLEENDEALLPGMSKNRLPIATTIHDKYTMTPEKRQAILNNLSNFSVGIANNSNLQPKEFLDELKKSLGSENDSSSNYITESIDDEKFRLRISNQSTNAYHANFNEKTTSVVVQLANGKFKGSKERQLVEFVYNPENLTKERMQGIVSGMRDWIQTGEYTDKNFDKFYVSPKERLQQNIAEQMTLGGIKKGILTGIVALSLASAMPKLQAETNYDLSKAQTDGIVQVQSKNVGISYFIDNSGKKYMKINNYNEESNSTNDICVYVDISEEGKENISFACNASDLYSQSLFEETRELRQTKKGREKLYSSTMDISVEEYNSIKSDELFLALSSPRGWGQEQLARKASLLTGNGNYVAQKMIQDSLTYGFVLNNKIYLNPEIINSNVIAHEYTHIWDKYTQGANPELWENGKDIFKKTNLWKEVVEDENYSNIKSNEDLILSECHARICGKFAQEVLNKIAVENGNKVKEEVVNWDKEVEQFIAKEFGIKRQSLENENEKEYEQLTDFLSLPIKDLIAGKEIMQNREKSMDITEEQTNDELKSSSVPENIQTVSASVLSFEQNKSDILDIIGKRFETDEGGKPTLEGMKSLSRAMEIYSDKHFETARYLFVKDGTVIRHLTVSSQTPASTVIKPDEDFLFRLKTYAQETESQVVFLHNHPSGYVEPSDADIELTEYLNNFLTSPDGVSYFSGHIILDHGSYGLYDAKERQWNALIDDKLMPLSEISKNYEIQLAKYGAKAEFNGNKTISEHSARELSELAKECDAGNVWNTEDWIPAFMLTGNGIVTSLEYINMLELQSEKSLSEKLKSIGRDYGSENVVFIPRHREQFLMCERFAQETGKVKEVIFENQDGTFDVSRFCNGNIFNDLHKDEVKIEDTEQDSGRAKDKIMYEQSVNENNYSKENKTAENRECWKWKNFDRMSTEELQEVLKKVLFETAEELPEMEYTNENYNALFPFSRIETPLGTVKMGEHQFEKLNAKNRHHLLKAVHDTLEKPDIIISEDGKDKNGNYSEAHLYAKSFFFNDKARGVQSVVVTIDGEKISVTGHERTISNIVNKIKKPDQLLYAAAKVGLLVERMAEKSVTINRDRVQEYVLPPNSNISHTEKMSTKNEYEINKNNHSKENKTMENEMADEFNTVKTLTGNALRKDFMDGLAKGIKLWEQEENKNLWNSFAEMYDDRSSLRYTDSQKEEIKQFVLEYTDSTALETALPRLEKIVRSNIAIERGADWEYDEKHQKVLKEDTSYSQADKENAAKNMNGDAEEFSLDEQQVQEVGRIQENRSELEAALEAEREKNRKLEELLKSRDNQLQEMDKKLDAIKEQIFVNKENSANDSLSAGSSRSAEQPRQNLVNREGFGRDTAYKVNTPVPAFGIYDDKTGETKIVENAKFSKLVEDKYNPGNGKVILEIIDEKGNSSHFKMEEREYNNIINNVQELEERKQGKDQNSFDWMKAHMDYAQKMQIDENMYRLNSPENFIHNFRVQCRHDNAHNPEQALKISGLMYKDMAKRDKERFLQMRKGFDKKFGKGSFDQTLVEEFNKNHPKSDIDIEKIADKTFDKEKAESEMNPVYATLKNGEQIEDTKVHVGDTIPLAMSFKNPMGETIKMPKTDWKIMSVEKSLNHDRAFLYDEKTKSYQTVPLDMLVTHIQKVEKHRAKEEKVQIKKDWKDFGFER